MTKLIYGGEHCFGGDESGIKANRNVLWVEFSLENHVLLMRYVFIGFLSDSWYCLLQVSVLHVESDWKWLCISILIGVVYAVFEKPFYLFSVKPRGIFLTLFS